MDVGSQWRWDSGEGKTSKTRRRVHVKTPPIRYDTNKTVTIECNGLFPLSKSESCCRSKWQRFVNSGRHFEKERDGGWALNIPGGIPPQVNGGLALTSDGIRSKEPDDRNRPRSSQLSNTRRSDGPSGFGGWCGIRTESTMKTSSSVGHACSLHIW